MNDVLITVAAIFLLLSFGADTVFASHDNAKTSDHVSIKIANELDLIGQHENARKLYDHLNHSIEGSNMSVASAVNYYALGQLNEAKKSFEKIKKGNNRRDADYASLWLMLLSSIETGHYAVVDDFFEDPIDLATSKMLAGKLSVSIYMDYIGQYSLENIAQKKDIITQAVFFASTLLVRVKRDHKSAYEIINSNKSRLYGYSLEKPLIDGLIVGIK